MRRAGQAMACGALLLACAAAASGHAFLERAEPRVGSTVRTPPSAVRLWFTEPLEPAFSSVTVTNSANQPVDKKDATVDPAQPTTLQVSLQPIGPGGYTVHWRVVSVDTHVTEGTFAFTLAP
jgi:copper resistance protein C